MALVGCSAPVARGMRCWLPTALLHAPGCFPGRLPVLPFPSRHAPPSLPSRRALVPPLAPRPALPALRRTC